MERLTYTRRQAAEALGISTSTFNRRVLPLIKTLKMDWGTCLVPVDELEGFLAERRRTARAVTRAPRGDQGGSRASPTGSWHASVRSMHLA